MDTLERNLGELLERPDRPYNPFRKKLYTVEELMAGYSPTNPHGSLDSTIASYYNKEGGQVPKRVQEALAQRIHDNAIDRGLIRFVQNSGDNQRKMVGIMGGHSASRTEPNYIKVALIARQLTLEGYCIVSGGGPGVMEAANLGAYIAPYSLLALQDALTILAQAPTYGKDDSTKVAYIEAAGKVRNKYPKGGDSLSIPTWAYSDEPISQFPSQIGKYFANSIREDGLLGIGVFGVIFAPGAAGTMQEIFQDATHNSYWTFHSRSPMVFLDNTFYRASPSIYDVLLSRANRDGYADLVTIQDDPASIVQYILDHPPRLEHPQLSRTLGRTTTPYKLD